MKTILSDKNSQTISRRIAWMNYKKDELKRLRSIYPLVKDTQPTLMVDNLVRYGKHIKEELRDYKLYPLL